MDAEAAERRALAKFVGPRVRHDPAPDTAVSTDLGTRIDAAESRWFSVERAEPDRYHLSRRNPADRAILEHADSVAASTQSDANEQLWDTVSRSLAAARSRQAATNAQCREV